MSPYISFVLEEFVGYWKAASASDPKLWFCMLTTVTKSMVHDDGGMSSYDSHLLV